jgi:hemoglobin
MSGERRVYVPPGGPPAGFAKGPEIYLQMGQENIFKMIEDFYLELEKSSIRKMFPEDMREASKKSAAFFVFLLGGPPLYQQLYGPPMMRKRHLQFEIDAEARNIWLECFRTVLIDADKKYGFPMEHRERFWTFLEQFSGWMVNTKRT